jgi:hypothetical protein
MNDKAWNYYKKEIQPLVIYLVHKKMEGNHFWYEVWIDLDERFDNEVWPVINGLPVEAAAKYVFEWLVKRDEYYGSPKYYEMLDKLVASADFQPA